MSLSSPLLLHQCAIALGSNLGDSQAILAAALLALAQTPGIELQRHSRWYQTTAIGPTQPDYLNGCAILQVIHSPDQLLGILLQLEQRFGRVRRQRWGPRSLDLDLLLYDDLILSSPDLEIPHPRMAARAFVLVPLAEIAPGWIEPRSGRSIAALAKAVDCRGIIKIL